MIHAHWVILLGGIIGLLILLAVLGSVAAGSADDQTEPAGAGTSAGRREPSQN